MDVAFKLELREKRIIETKDMRSCGFSFLTVPDREKVKDEERLFKRGSLVSPSLRRFLWLTSNWLNDVTQSS
jgi:hypothetical protein